MKLKHIFVLIVGSLLIIGFPLLIYYPHIYSRRAEIAQTIWMPYCSFLGKKTHAYNTNMGEFPHVSVKCYEIYRDGGKSCNNGNHCQSGTCIIPYETIQKLFPERRINDVSLFIGDEYGYCHGDARPVDTLPEFVYKVNEGKAFPARVFRR